MIGFTPPRWQELRERYRNLDADDVIWAWLAWRDYDGMVRIRPLLANDVERFVNEAMADAEV